jgi:hypothetical protein
MALVTSGAVVVDVEAKVWTLLYWCVVVPVEVSLATVPLLSQFIEDDVRRWFVESVCSCIANNVRFPATVNAPPGVALEALDTQPAVIGIVSA